MGRGLSIGIGIWGGALVSVSVYGAGPESFQLFVKLCQSLKNVISKI